MTHSSPKPIPIKRKYDGAIRAAIYCRVSSNKKDQISSLISQISALTNHIAHMPQYVLFDTYIDVASGSTMKGRPEFQRLVNDCRSGRIKYVLTKSASRFGRDIVIALSAVHSITVSGALIYFMEEGIASDNVDMIPYLTAHLAVAEIENKNRSENIKWGINTGAELKTSKIYNRICYGYKHNKSGELIINNGEADNVRFIFRLYLDGHSINSIIKILKLKHIPSPTGKETWSKHSIEKMLSNIKYTGDSSIATDNGTYLYSEHHPAIIFRDTFNAVQLQKAMRSNIEKSLDGTIKRSKKKYSGKKVILETIDIAQFADDFDIDLDNIK